MSPASRWQQSQKYSVYPRRYSAQEMTLFWRKLNKLSENLSFASIFVLVFDIEPFKVDFFVVAVLDANFSKHYRAEWVNVDIPVVLVNAIKEKLQNYSDGLRNLVSFVQFKKREKHPCRNVTFSKVATLLKVALLMGVFYVQKKNCTKSTKCAKRHNYFLLCKIGK